MTPLVAALRVSATAAVKILPSKSAPSFSVAPSGDWGLRRPGGGYRGRSAGEKRPVHGAVCHGDELHLQSPDLLGLALAIPLSKKTFRTFLCALLLGATLVALAEVLSLVTFVEVAAWNALAGAHPERSEFAKWLLELTNYLAICVTPFLAPFLVAAGVHRELRSMIARWVEPTLR